MAEQDTTDLLERAYRRTAEVFDAISEDALGTPTPCSEWTVRDVGNHLVGALIIFARIAEGEQLDPAEFADESDRLGADPAAAYRFAAERCLAAFRRPGVLDSTFPFVFGPTPGHVIAGISLSETLIHGWDIARAADVDYRPDDAVVAAVLDMQSQGDPADRTESGMFAPEVAVSPSASAFEKLLGLLGRDPAFVHSGRR